MPKKKKIIKDFAIYPDLSNPKVYEKFVRGYSKTVAMRIRKIELELARMFEAGLKDRQLRKRMAKSRKKKEEGFWERVARISKEVDTWPESKKYLGGFSSNYCSELQPIQYSCNKEECMSCEYWNREMKIGMNDVWCNFFHAFVGAIGGGDSCVHYIIRKESRRGIVKNMKRPQTVQSVI